MEKQIKISQVIGCMLIFLISGARADVWNTTRKGIEAYKNKNYELSAKYFEEALKENPSDNTLYYNLGTALAASDKAEDAIKLLKKASRDAKPEIKEKAFYNLGNAFFNQQKYKEALQAYREALKIDPSDKDAKYNYELTRNKLKEQQQQQQNQPQNQNKQNQKDNQQKDQQKDQQKNENKDQENKDQKQDQRKDQQNQQPKIDKKTAEQILKALREKEKENKKKAQKAKGAKVKVEKDW
ncbi:MAG: hypothetical protein Kow00108_16860 [Calditrichia bacterium]